MTQIRRAEREIVSHSDPTCETTLSLRVLRLIDLRSGSGGMLKRENRHKFLYNGNAHTVQPLAFQKTLR